LHVNTRAGSRAACAPSPVLVSLVLDSATVSERSRLSRPEELDAAWAWLLISDTSSHGSSCHISLPPFMSG
jgi:hypothetical protein